MKNNYLIKKPIITERSLEDASKGVYTFEVLLSAKKQQIKKAIEEMFNVNVTKITVVRVKGKKRQVGKKRVKVKESDSKKARVLLKENEKIDLFETSS